jgi:hypothetical protein
MNLRETPDRTFLPVPQETVLEINADNLSKAGWGWGCVAAIDSNGRTIWIADAHRGDGKRFVVRADEKLTAFLELESAIRVVSAKSAQSAVCKIGPRQVR